MCACVFDVFWVHITSISNGKSATEHNKNLYCKRKHYRSKSVFKVKHIVSDYTFSCPILEFSLAVLPNTNKIQIKSVMHFVLNNA